MERYIDVKRFCQWLKNLESGFTKEELVFRDELIEHLQGNNGITNVLPPVDVVEVVRCKDCNHSYFIKSCSKYECKKGCGTLKNSNDYCSYGERKE